MTPADTPVLVKLMILTLYAIYPDLSISAQSFVGPADVQGCYNQATIIAEEWSKQEPTIIAIKPECREIDNPVIELKQFFKDHPKEREKGSI